MANSNIDHIAKIIATSGLHETLIFFLKEENILSESVALLLLDLETTKTEAARILLKHIFSAICSEKMDKNRDAMLKIVTNVCVTIGLRDVAELIDPENTAMSKASDPNCQLGRQSLQTLPHIPSSPSLPALPITPIGPTLPESSFSYSSDLNEAANNIMVNVTPTQFIYGGDDHPDIYKNESTPRGLAFIVNMFKFENDVHKKREGSHVDVQNLNELFTQMGYQVHEHHDLSRAELRKALQSLSEDSSLASTDSLVVVAMSHGGTCGSHLVTADNRLIADNDIFDYFNNKNCPSLIGKPKIFIFQFCRGSQPDIGVASAPSRVVHVPQDTDLTMDGINMGETISYLKMPIYSDFYIIYATVQGFVAYLNKNRGSWLIESLCLEFMEHAHNTELDALVKKISRRVSALQSSEGRKQVAEIRHINFEKHFYFNPVHISQLQNLQGLDMLSLTDSSAHPLNLSATPPHQRIQRYWDSTSRCCSPDLTNYELQPSGSGFRLRSRNSSGASVGSRGGPGAGESNFLSLTPKTNLDEDTNKGWAFPRSRRWSSTSAGARKGSLGREDTDVVDTFSGEKEGRPISGTAEDFHQWRLYHDYDHGSNHDLDRGSNHNHGGGVGDTPCEREVNPPSLKRQLSTPSESEVLKNVHGIRTYLQVHDLEEYLPSLIPIRKAIETKKKERKRPKNNSLEY